MTAVARPYGGDIDFPRLIDLLVTCQAAGYADMGFRSIELRIALANPTFDVPRFTRLWKDADGELLAFAILWQGRYLGMLVAPGARGEMEDQVLEWAAGQIRAAEGAPAGQRQLYALCRDDDDLSQAHYIRAGFVLDEEELRMARRLDEVLPAPAVPPGFAIRPLAGQDELEAWLALYEEAFGPRLAAIRRWRAIRQDPDHDSALDLVAVDQRGELAAMCYCSIASAEATRSAVKEGRTEPIAVRERYRRLGLGRAIVLTGLRLLRERGMQVAALTTEPDNFPAHRLYESLGYRTIYRAQWYVRDV